MPLTEPHTTERAPLVSDGDPLSVRPVFPYDPWLTRTDELTRIDKTWLCGPIQLVIANVVVRVCTRGVINVRPVRGVPLTSVDRYYISAQRAARDRLLWMISHYQQVIGDWHSRRTWSHVATQVLLDSLTMCLRRGMGTSVPLTTQSAKLLLGMLIPRS